MVATDRSLRRAFRTVTPGDLVHVRLDHGYPDSNGMMGEEFHGIFLLQRGDRIASASFAVLAADGLGAPNSDGPPLRIRAWRQVIAFRIVSRLDVAQG